MAPLKQKLSSAESAFSTLQELLTSDTLTTVERDAGYYPAIISPRLGEFFVKATKARDVDDAFRRVICQN